MSITKEKFTRGFVTVATGDEIYYKCAMNLLRSYRLFNSKYPFAIICDRKNKYTEEFDDVVILDNAKRNYVDKLSVFVKGPYDENFFIESDCIVYKNIEFFFDLLAKDCDFSAFGWNDGDLKTWFSNPKQVIDQYGEKASTIRIFNPGYFFVRKSETCKKIYNDAIAIGEWIKENNIEGGEITLFNKGMLRDDPLIALSATLNDCICHEKPSVGKCVFLPRIKKVYTISLSKRKLNVLQEKKFDDCSLMHFSTRRTKEEGLYLQQSLVVNMLHKKYPLWLVKIMEKKFIYILLHSFRRFKFGIIHRIKK